MMHVSSANSSKVHNVMMRPPAGYAQHNARPSHGADEHHHAQVIPESPPIIDSVISSHPFRSFYGGPGSSGGGRGVQNTHSYQGYRESDATKRIPSQDGVIPESPARDNTLPTDSELFGRIKNPFGAFTAGGGGSGSPTARRRF